MQESYHGHFVAFHLKYFTWIHFATGKPVGRPVAKLYVRNHEVQNLKAYFIQSIGSFVCRKRLNFLVC